MYTYLYTGHAMYYTRMQDNVCIYCLQQIQNTGHVEGSGKSRKESRGVCTKWHAKVDDNQLPHVSQLTHFFLLLHRKMSQTSQSAVRMLTSCPMKPTFPAVPRLDSTCSYAQPGEHTLIVCGRSLNCLGTQNLTLVFPVTTCVNLETSSSPPASSFTWHTIDLQYIFINSLMN